MKGTTHLTIGIAIGTAAAFYYPFSISNAAAYLTVAAISALSADLDGPSLLSAKLGKLSKLINKLIHICGWLFVCGLIYLYWTKQYFNLTLTAASVAFLLLGLVTSQGAIRNALVSLVGLGLIYTGVISEMTWMIGFGIFTAWAPWLKHRGLTHTIWAAIAWTAISYGFERYLDLPGIMRVGMLGYLSHLIADTLTPNGVKWFYPLYKKAIKLR